MTATQSVQLYVDHKRAEWVLVMRKGDVVFVDNLGFARCNEQLAVERATERLAAHGMSVKWTHVPNPNHPGYTGVVTARRSLRVVKSKEIKS